MARAGGPARRTVAEAADGGRGRGVPPTPWFRVAADVRSGATTETTGRPTAPVADVAIEPTERTTEPTEPTAPLEESADAGDPPSAASATQPAAAIPPTVAVRRSAVPRRDGAPAQTRAASVPLPRPTDPTPGWSRSATRHYTQSHQGVHPAVPRGSLRDTRRAYETTETDSPPEAEMPIATPEVYAQMLDRAKADGFAYPAINVTSSETVNAAMKGFADAGSDGIIQISTGGAEFASGTGVKDMVTGAVALAEFARVVGAKYPVNVAMHTDHCPKDKLDTYLRPLLEISLQRVRNGRDPLFGSHMWDGSAVELEENLRIAKELLEKCAEAHVVLEIEIGVVGGEEDGVVGEMNEKLYSTPGDALRVVEELGTGERGRYLLAATFGNVHGVYKPGNVQLRPSVLKEIQDSAAAAHPGHGDKPFDLVFHGGSGSALEEIREAVSYGVVKMNVDTDTQYAFTRPIADHMFKNYDGVLKVDGDVGSKKAYDPRSYLKRAETTMAARVVEACEDLLSAGKSIAR